MKDYTKYDFPRIFNSRVYVEYMNIEGKKSCMSGILLTQTQTEICIQDDINHESFWAIEKKAITYLTAKTTPRRMTLEQLHSYYKAFAEREGYEDYVAIIRGGEVEEPSNRITYSLKRTDAEDIEEFGPWTNDVDEPLDDYIDCTDWGWKHE